MRQFLENSKTGMLTWILFLLGFLALISPPIYAADIEVITAKLEASDDGYRIGVAFSFELGNEIRTAINEGIPISFITEVEISRPRWYWFDEKTIRSTQTIKIQYDLWRRQYTAAVNGGLKQNFSSLDEIITLVQRSRRWLIAEKNALISGATYNVGVRLKLDSTQLSKPMLMTTLTHSDWRLASEWKRFTYRVEDK